MDALTVTRRVYDTLTHLSDAPAPALRTWTGEILGHSDAAATIVLNHPGALRRMLLPPTDLTAGEAYVFGDVDIEGDILAVVRFAAGLERIPVVDRLRLFGHLRSLPADTGPPHPRRPKLRGLRHSLGRDRRAISRHYDTGNDFFATFLDEHMVYSCAYFLDPDEPLDAAQERKLDVICRKLELAEGERLLDVGCGWGALAIHAAERFGAEVVGITLSREQATYAAKWAADRGLAGRCAFRVQDYREVEGRFDKISSIGMFEHVGAAKLHTYFRSMLALLAPGGLMLNHGITTRDRSRSRPTATFVNTYVFPDGELQPVEVAIEAAERAGFELRDLESLRASYARTLERWVANLEVNRQRAVAAADERTYRIWRLYMAGSAIAFDRSAISVYQMLLADPVRPWSYGRRRLLASDDR